VCSSDLALLAGAGLISAIIIKNKANTSTEDHTVDINDKLAFLRAMKPVAEAIYQDFGIKSTITISQSALESAWGTSGLTRDANNLFGIKASASWIAGGGLVWTGKTLEYLDPENPQQAAQVSASFRAYEDYLSSARDWARLISTSSRYVKLLSYAKSGDVAAFGNEIHNSGYATDPNYGTSLVALAKFVNQYV
jgi:flagellum-specific peptidoglycan hydrolase FlgJ